MEVLNNTGFMLAPLAGRMGFPGHSLTLIIKATFDLKPGAEAVVSDEQLFPTGSEYYEDDDEGTGSSRYDSDFAYYKPHSDLFLVGNCHPPAGNAVTACRVTFQVGNYAKPLAVFGNRYWQGIMQKQSAPEAFNSMPLKYENSYGGEGFKNNPVGKGSEKIQQEDGSLERPLPNIENIQQLITSPSQHPDPVGFGPLGPMWQERYAKMGSYKGAWLKEQWPWFPKDFDWSHFNAAPADMQIKGYLSGDEELFFENLHPDYPQYYSKLPGNRIRLFINERNPSNQSDAEFKEIEMNLDTLWVDMEAEKLVLVWRGISAVQTEEYDEIQHVFIASEKVDEPAQSVDYYYDLFLKKLAEEESDESFEVKPIDEVEDSKEIGKLIAEVEAKMRASLEEAEIDPGNLPEPTPEQKAEEAKLLKEFGVELEEQTLTRENFIRRVKNGEGFVGEDLRGLDLSGLDIKAINLQSAIMSGVCFKNTDLSGAILSEVDLSLADLSNVNLTGVNLKDADLTNANLNGANLTGALLDDALFEKANLAGAILDETSALNTIFVNANLSQARLVNSMLKGADFSKCNLGKANFQAANLCEASVEGASGREVNMGEADLTELRATNGCDFSSGYFAKAKGRESIWIGATLTNSDFSYSSMEGANFSSANLISSNFSAANMKFSRFTGSNLQEAKFIQMNLFQGSLEKANLTRTDLRGSNLYGAEFLDAIIVETEFEYSNLKMTKLSNG